MKTRATEMSPIGKSQIVIDTENTLATGNEKVYDVAKGSENANDGYGQQGGKLLDDEQRPGELLGDGHIY